MANRVPESVHLGDRSEPPTPPPGRPPASDTDLGQLRRVFLELKKALKTTAFNRHRTDQYLMYIAPAHGLLSAYLAIHKACEIKLEVSTFVVGATQLLEDDDREGNLIYPLYQAGVRLLVLREGVSAESLLKFFLAVHDFKRNDEVGSDELLTSLWKAELPGIEWVVVTDYALIESSASPDDDIDVDIAAVLSYVQDRLRTPAAALDGLAFARVSVADLDLRLQDVMQIRQTFLAEKTVEGIDARSIQTEVAADDRALLERITRILVDVLSMPASSDEVADILAAFEQLLDGLVLEGQFAMIDTLLERCEGLASNPALPTPTRDLGRVCGDKLFMLMHEGQRVRSVGHALNSGRTRDLEAVRRYLLRLGTTATLLLLDLLDTLNAPGHRRLVADVIAEVGGQGVPMFARRLPTASSNLAKDLLYIIDKINPPDKNELFAPILHHENAVLRMEGLTTIGNTKNEQSFRILKDVAEAHDVPQMRAHAMRILADFPPAWSERVLLNVVTAPNFEDCPEGEKRAAMASLVRLDSEKARGWVRGIFAEKAGLLNRKKVGDRKLMAIAALQTVPGMPSLQLLAEIAKDPKTQGNDVAEAAKAAALEMKRRLLGT